MGTRGGKVRPLFIVPAEARMQSDTVPLLLLTARYDRVSVKLLIVSRPAEQGLEDRPCVQRRHARASQHGEVAVLWRSQA